LSLSLLGMIGCYNQKDRDLDVDGGDAVRDSGGADVAEETGPPDTSTAADTAPDSVEDTASDTAPEEDGSVDGGAPDTSRCDSGLEFCGGQCVDTASSLDHCGSCGNACGSAETCHDGSCLSCTAEEVCPADSEAVTCRSRQCRALTCKGFNHPCQDGAKCCSWKTFGKIAQAPDQVTRLRLAYAPDGTRYVVYASKSAADRQQESFFIDGLQGATSPSKISQTVPGGSGLNLDVDSAGRPHVIYRAGSLLSNTPTEMKHLIWKNGSWSRSTVERGVTGGTYAIGIDSKDRPHFLVRKSTNATAIYPGPGGQQKTKSFGGANSSVKGQNVVFNDQDLARVVFRNDYSEFKFAWLTPAGGWRTNTLESKNIFGADLEMKPGGHARIAYRDRGDNVYYAERSASGNWTKSKVATGAYRLDLVFDADNNPRIFFWTESNGKELLQVTRRIDGKWREKTVYTDSDDGGLQQLSVARSPSGNIGVAFTEQDKLKFIEW
jgi:hypothetical protein